MMPASLASWAAPATCAELARAKPWLTDGEVTLYQGGDVTKPFAAYCHRMGTATPTEYLTLPHGNGSGESLEA